MGQLTCPVYRRILPAFVKTWPFLHQWWSFCRLHPCRQQRPQIPFTSVEMIDSFFSLAARSHGVNLEYGLDGLKASLQGCSGKLVETERGKEQKRERVSINPGHYLQKTPT